MARKRKKRSRVHTKRKTSSNLSARPRKHRRRRMSAGTSAFKVFSNPLVGGLGGAIAGLLVKKVLKKVTLPGGEMTATLVPIGAAFVLRKKLPFVAAGLASGAAASFIVSKFPALGDDASFVNDNLLNAGAPLVLDASGDEVIGYSLRDSLLSDYGMIRNSPQGMRDELSDELNDLDED